MNENGEGGPTPSPSNSGSKMSQQKKATTKDVGSTREDAGKDGAKVVDLGEVRAAKEGGAAVSRPRGRPKKEGATREEYIELLKRTFPDKDPVRDLISGSLMVRHKGEWICVEDGSGLKLFLSEVSEQGSRFSRAVVPFHLEHYRTSLQPKLLLDTDIEWDRRDRLAEMAGALKAAYFTRDQVIELIKDWVITAYRRMLNPTIQNRALIFQGPQGLGKDTFISALVAPFAGLSRWGLDVIVIGRYIASFTFQGNTKEDDVARVFCNNGIVVISEYDRTGRISNETLKAAITEPTATWVEKWEVKPQTKLKRASIIASINPKDINTDPSGARRYLPIELLAIDWKYIKSAENSLQILAQIVAQAPRWKGLSEGTKEALRKVQARLTPDDPIDVAIHEAFTRVNLLAEQRRDSGRQFAEETVTIQGVSERAWKIPNEDIQPLLKTIADDHDLRLRDLQGRLKQSEREKRTAVSRSYYVPILRLEEPPALKEPEGLQEEDEDDFPYNF